MAKSAPRLQVKKPHLFLKLCELNNLQMHHIIVNLLSAKPTKLLTDSFVLVLRTRCTVTLQFEIQD